MAINLDGNGLLTTGLINSATAQNSTSGTSIDFTGIPAGVKRITVMLNGASKSGSSNFIFQLGDSGGIETTGYSAQGGGGFTGNVFITVASSIAFPMAGDADPSVNVSGSIVFTNLSGNIWIGSGNFYTSNGYNTSIAGTKTLSATLDRVRVTTPAGTDTFDAGSINILYE